MSLILSDEMVEEIVKEFYKEARLPRYEGWDVEKDKELIEKSKVAMIKALDKVYTITFAYGESSFSDKEGSKEMALDDEDYMLLAKYAARESTCAKKQLGCVLVMTRGCKGYIQGTNGPPYPLEKCEPCPRLNSHSGTDTDKCRAVHAERQVLLLAAKFGFCTKGAILYSYMGVPCSQCMLELIQAGVAEIVCQRETYYDELSREILNEWVAGGGEFRVFNSGDV